MPSFNLTAVMYHYVRDPGDSAEAGSGIPGLPVAQFAAQLDFLAGRYAPIAWPDLREALLGRASLPPKPCMLTFDDGVRDHYLNVFPLLRERGLSGLFFGMARKPGERLAFGHRVHVLMARLGLEGLRQAVVERLSMPLRVKLLQAEAGYRARAHSETDVFKMPVQRDLSAEAGPILSDLIAEHIGDEAQLADELYLSPAQAAEMREAGMHFGGHSRCHPWFDWIPAERQVQEIGESAAWLRGIEPGPWPFAYPYGGFNQDSPGLVRAGGFAAAFTTVTQVEHTDPFLIGRLDGESLVADPQRGLVGAAAE